MIAQAERVGPTGGSSTAGGERESMAFLDELARYGDRVVGAPAGRNRSAGSGVVLGGPRDDTLIYCWARNRCWPRSKSTAVAWPAKSLHIERFAPKPVGDAAPTEAFEIALASSGLTLTVPGDRSILSVVEEAGISVLSSCGEGTCGSCEVPVLDGKPDHRDSVLDEDERQANDCMMICVSRACSARLTLDL